jgi:arylformamidase
MNDESKIKTIYQSEGKTFCFNPSSFFDLSLALDVHSGPRAWYQGDPVFEPVRTGEWIGEVKSGGSVNFRNILFNPHAQMTHTESVGHISKEIYSVNKIQLPVFIPAMLISVLPASSNGDLVIEDYHLEIIRNESWARALLIRTLPNTDEKRTIIYSDKNPPYLSNAAGTLIANSKIKHLLIDTPSVDRERDEGRLDVHHIFWNYPQQPRMDHTITELFFAPDQIPDGYYMLSLQVAPFENDAAPSRPLIFPGKFE